MPRAAESVRSAWNATYSAQVATVAPRPGARFIRRITIIGPDFSKFTFYNGLTIADQYIKSTTNLGVRNTASFDPPVELGANESALGVWTGGNTASNTPAVLTIEWDADSGQ